MGRLNAQKSQVVDIFNLMFIKYDKSYSFECTLLRIDMN